MKEEIINLIKAKFILGIPEGMLLEEHDWKNMEIPDHEKEKYRRHFSTESDSGYMTTDRQNIRFGTGDSNPLSLLTELYFKTKFRRKSRTSGYYEDYYEKYEESTYKAKVLYHFANKCSLIQSIIGKCEDILKTQNINESDTIFVNVGKRMFGYEDPYGRKPKLYNSFTVEEPNATYKFTKVSNCRQIETVYADIFIINKQRFCKISVAPGGVIEHVEHLIIRDIKRTNIHNNNMLEVYFHGVYDPETIVLIDYNEALIVQTVIMKFRNSFNNSRSYFHNKKFNKTK